MTSRQVLTTVPWFQAIREANRVRLLTFYLGLITGFALTASSALAGTKIVRSWVSTDHPIPKLQKVLVIAVLDNYIIRQELEDEMEKLLAKAGVEGVKGHLVLPSRNEMAESELKEHIKAGDFDAVLVIRPKAQRTETKEVFVGVPGRSYRPISSYNNFWPYWNMAWSQVATTSQFEENNIVNAEFNLYYTKDEKLLWSGETDTVYSKDFKKLGREYARALVKQLKKEKVIGEK